jgi:CBS domain-containing protein
MMVASALRVEELIMVIRDILNMKGGTIFSVAPDSMVFDAVGMMVKHDIGSLVVMADGGMVGMVTFREVLKALDSHAGNLAGLRVSEVMVADAISGSPDDTIDHLREVMTKNHVRYLPVTDGGQLLGVISFHDVAKSVIKETSFENRLLKRYIKNWPEADEAHK